MKKIILFLIAISSFISTLTQAECFEEPEFNKSLELVLNMACADFPKQIAPLDQLSVTNENGTINFFPEDLSRLGEITDLYIVAFSLNMSHLDKFQGKVIVTDDLQISVTNIILPQLISKASIWFQASELELNVQEMNIWNFHWVSTSAYACMHLNGNITTPFSYEGVEDSYVYISLESDQIKSLEMNLSGDGYIDIDDPNSSQSSPQLKLNILSKALEIELDGLNYKKIEIYAPNEIDMLDLTSHSNIVTPNQILIVTPKIDYLKLYNTSPNLLLQPINVNYLDHASSSALNLDNLSRSIVGLKDLNIYHSKGGAVTGSLGGFSNLRTLKLYLSATEQNTLLFEGQFLKLEELVVNNATITGYTDFQNLRGLEARNVHCVEGCNLNFKNINASSFIIDNSNNLSLSIRGKCEISKLSLVNLQRTSGLDSLVQSCLSDKTQELSLSQIKFDSIRSLDLSLLNALTKLSIDAIPRFGVKFNSSDHPLLEDLVISKVEEVEISFLGVESLTSLNSVSLLKNDSAKIYFPTEPVVLSKTVSHILLSDLEKWDFPADLRLPFGPTSAFIYLDRRLPIKKIRKKNPQLNLYSW